MAEAEGEREAFEPVVTRNVADFGAVAEANRGRSDQQEMAGVRGQRIHSPRPGTTIRYHHPTVRVPSMALWQKRWESEWRSRLVAPTAPSMGKERGR